MVSGHGFEPKIVGFLCNWCCYAGADLCGVSRYEYPPNIRIIRLMCSGRVDPAFIFHAFSKGADGVFIGGCWLGDCHYLTEGNYDALSMMHLSKKLLGQAGINPDRLRLEWVSAAEGIRFSEVITDFTARVKGLGPLGSEEGIDEKELKSNLDAAKSLIPYVKLVERQSLRVRFKTNEEYDEFFASDEADRLFQEAVADKMATIRIMSLLREKPLSTGEISDTLKLNPFEVSRLLNNSTKHGLVRFNESQKLYAPA